MREATDGRGVDVVLDSIGAAYLERQPRGASRIGGRLVLIGLMGGAKAEMNLALLLARRLHVIGSTLRTRPVDEKAAMVAAFDAPLRRRPSRVGAIARSSTACCRSTRSPTRTASIKASEHFGKIVLRVALIGRGALPATGTRGSPSAAIALACAPRRRQECEEIEPWPSSERCRSSNRTPSRQTGHRSDPAAIQEAGLRIIALKMMRLTEEQARGFYAVHKARPFFADLVKFMTSGPVVVSVLEGEDAIARWRELMGPTDSTKAPKGTIRGDFGTDVERNAVHGSDAPETARRRDRLLLQCDRDPGARRGPRLIGDAAAIGVDQAYGPDSSNMMPT